MAITSGGQISVKIKVSTPDPQTLFVKTVPAMTMTDTDGNVTVSAWRTYIGVLHSKIMTIEGRGYNGPIEKSGSSKVEWANTTNDGNVDTESFVSKSVSYDQQRINEAGFWRVVKTVTITALYIDNNKVAGQTTFDNGDDAI